MIFFKFFLIYIFSFYSTSVFLSGLLGKFNSITLERIIISSLVLSQILLSWYLEKIMYLFNDLEDKFYVYIILLIFTLQLFIFKRYTGIVFNYILYYLNKNYIVIFYALIVFLISFIISINLPIISNDPLEYINVAQNIYKYKTFSIYPLIDTSLMDGYFPWTHPSSFVSIISWSFILQENSSSFLLLKLFNPIFMTATFLLFTSLFDKNIYFSLFAGFLALFISPIYMLLIFDFHIDPMRIFSFFIVFLFLYKIDNIRKSIFIGILFGFAMHSHSIGILSLAIFIGIILYSFFIKEKISLKSILIVFFTTFIFVGFRYYINYDTFGYIVGDNTALWEVKEFYYNEYLEYSRNLFTFENKIFHGILKGFVNFDSFGFLYWLFICFMCLYIYKKLILKKFNKKMALNDKILEHSYLVVFYWYLGSSFLMILGSNILIKNDRYLLTINFFVIYILLKYIEIFLFRDKDE